MNSFGRFVIWFLFDSRKLDYESEVEDLDGHFWCSFKGSSFWLRQIGVVLRDCHGFHFRSGWFRPFHQRRCSLLIQLRRCIFAKHQASQNVLKTNVNELQCVKSSSFLLGRLLLGYCSPFVSVYSQAYLSWVLALSGFLVIHWLARATGPISSLIGRMKRSVAVSRHACCADSGSFSRSGSFCRALICKSVRQNSIRLLVEADRKSLTIILRLMLRSGKRLIT